MNNDRAIGFLPPLIVLGTICLVLLTGCANTMQVLEGADYVCVTGDITGRWTGSQIDGRGLKLPDGETLTPDTIEALCP